MQTMNEEIRLELSIVGWVDQRATRFKWLDRPVTRLRQFLGWLLRPTAPGIVIGPQFYHGTKPIGNVLPGNLLEGAPLLMRVSIPCNHVLCEAQHEALLHAVTHTRELVRLRLTWPGDMRACPHHWPSSPRFPTSVPTKV